MVAGDSTKFALISDLTSFVQVGDVLFKDGKQLVIAEVKEGEKNRKIMDFARFMSEAKCGHAARLFYEEEGKHGVHQLQRLVRQIGRMDHVVQLVNTGRSRDPDLGADVYVPEQAHEVESFDDRLSEIIESSRTKGWAFSVVDECLFLGAYRPPKLQLARLTFQAWFESCGGRKGFPIAHLRESLLAPLALPVFCRQIPREQQFDVLFGRCVVFLAIQVDSFIELAARHGLNVRWTSRKEAAKLVKGQFFRVDNRVLVVDEDKRQMVVGDGVFFRMMFHGMTPVSGVRFLRRSFDDSPEPASPPNPA